MNKKINLNKLFIPFDNKDDILMEKNVLSTFKYVNLTCFTNYILKFDNIIKNLTSNNILSDLDITKQKYVIYLKGLIFLKNLNLHVEQNYINFRNEVNIKFIHACNLLLEFFEQHEKYEYCIVISSYLNKSKQILKENLAI